MPARTTLSGWVLKTTKKGKAPTLGRPRSGSRLKRRLSDQMAYVYILGTSSGKYYIGSTADLDRRVRQHQNKNTYSTKRLGKLDLIFSQEYHSLSDARSIERKLKKLKRRDYIEKIIKEGEIRIKP